MNRKRKVWLVILILASLLVTAFFLTRSGEDQTGTRRPQNWVSILEKIKLKLTKPEKEVDLSSLRSSLEKEISSYKGDVAIAVTDLKTGKQVSVEGDKIFFPASAIKPLILVSVLKDVEKGSYKLSSVNDLVSNMMKSSSNYAANNLMIKIGLNKLSNIPAEIGMTNTIFIHGFSDGDPNVPRAKVGANAMTANDANLFWQKLYTESLLGAEMTKKALEYAKLPNKSLIHSPQGISVYHKPGYVLDVDLETYIDCGVVEGVEFSYAVSYFSRNNPTHQEGADFGLRLTKLIYEWFIGQYGS